MWTVNLNDSKFIFVFFFSPYFQKIFTDNPCKHPIIVLKDVRGWEVQCIVDFMYKGETSVPESQLTSLIKAAESLKVRGLTSSDQSLPPGALSATTAAGGSRSNSRHSCMGICGFVNGWSRDRNKIEINTHSELVTILLNSWQRGPVNSRIQLSSVGCVPLKSFLMFLVETPSFTDGLCPRA